MHYHNIIANLVFHFAFSLFYEQQIYAACFNKSPVVACLSSWPPTKVQKAQVSDTTGGATKYASRPPIN